jgi:hypothetical protein
MREGARPAATSRSGKQALLLEKKHQVSCHFHMQQLLVNEALTFAVLVDLTLKSGRCSLLLCLHFAYHIVSY